MSGGMAVLVNWLGHGDDPVSGDEAARLFIAAASGLDGHPGDPPAALPYRRCDLITSPAGAGEACHRALGPVVDGVGHRG